MNSNNLACWAHALVVFLLIVMTVHPQLGLLSYKVETTGITLYQGIMPTGVASYYTEGTTTQKATFSLTGYVTCEDLSGDDETVCQRCLATEVFYLMTILYFILLVPLAHGPSASGGASAMNKIFLVLGLGVLLCFVIAAAACAGWLDNNTFDNAAYDFHLPIGFIILGVVFILEVVSVTSRWKA